MHNGLPGLARRPSQHEAQRRGGQRHRQPPRARLLVPVLPQGQTERAAPRHGAGEPAAPRGTAPHRTATPGPTGTVPATVAAGGTGCPVPGRSSSLSTPPSPLMSCRPRARSAQRKREETKTPLPARASPPASIARRASRPVPPLSSAPITARAAPQPRPIVLRGAPAFRLAAKKPRAGASGGRARLCAAPGQWEAGAARGSRCILGDGVPPGPRSGSGAHGPCPTAGPAACRELRVLRRVRLLRVPSGLGPASPHWCSGDGAQGVPWPPRVLPAGESVRAAPGAERCRASDGGSNASGLLGMERFPYEEKLRALGLLA